MTWPDVASQAITAFRPYLIYFVGLFLFWLLLRITDQTMMGLVHGLLNEFGNLVERKGNAKSANALGIILFFVLAVYLFNGGISHIVLPEKGSEAHTTELMSGIYTAVLFIFGGVVLLSIWLTKYQR